MPNSAQSPKLKGCLGEEEWLGVYLFTSVCIYIYVYNRLY